MASSKARQMDMFLNGLHDSSGQPLKAYKVYFWTNSGASTEKTVWSDINKTAVIDQSSGVTLGNKGELDVYGDGEYYVQVKTPAGVLHDSFTISYSSTVDFGGLYIDVGADFGTTGTKVQEALDSLNPLQQYTLLFKGADFTIGQDIIFPDNVLLKGMITATINQTAGTITINRTPDLPDFQFFTGSPSVIWGSKVREVKLVWTEGDITGKSVNFYGDQTINGGQTVTGSQSVSVNSAITGNQTVGGTLGVTGNQTNSANLTVAGNQTIGGTLDVTGNQTISNASPQFSLIDTGSGASQTQKISYQTADGEYAAAQGETTGAGEGRYNIYTDNGSGLASRISIGYEPGGLFNIMANARIHRINTGSFGSPSKMMIIDNRSSTGASHFHGLLIVSQSSSNSHDPNAGIWQISCISGIPSTSVTNIGPASSSFTVAVDAHRIYVWSPTGGTFNFECFMIVNGVSFAGLITTPSLI